VAPAKQKAADNVAPAKKKAADNAAPAKKKAADNAAPAKKKAADENVSTKTTVEELAKTTVEELAVATAKALTAPANPDEETLDQQNARINAEMAAVYQALDLENWSKCRFAALGSSIKGAISETYDPKILHLPYQFVERTFQAYSTLQKDMAEHPEAGKYLLGAVQATLVTIPKKLTAKCEAAAIAARLRPVLDSVFIQKKKGSRSGYAAMLCKNDSFGYADICKYPAVWDHYLQDMMKRGDANGYPIVEPGETFPTAHSVYDAVTAQPEYKATSRKPHPEVPVFRYASLTNALEYVSLLAMIFRH
jgi:hypothetical protein